MNLEYIYLLKIEVSINEETCTLYNAYSTEKKAKQAFINLQSNYEKNFEQNGFLSDGEFHMNDVSAFASYNNKEHYYFINLEKIPLDITNHLPLSVFFKE